jgi:hypothetical protein
MRKIISKTMSIVMVASVVQTSSTMAAQVQGNLKACKDPITFKSNQQKVIDQAGQYLNQQFSAMCGKAVSPMTGQVAPYRTFTLPNGIVVDQYQITKNGVQGVETVLFEGERVARAPRVELQNNYGARDVRPEPRQQVIVEKNETHYLRDSLIVLGVVGGVVVGYKMVKASSAKSAAEKQAAYEQGVRDSQEKQSAYIKSVAGDMPTEIIVTEDVIVDGKVVIKKGTKMATAGAIPSSGAQGIGTSTGRFTSNGQQYVVMQNPNSGLLETLLIMDYLNRPFMWGSYYYTSYGYSPFYYGPHGGIMIYDTYPSHVWDTMGYNTEVYNTSKAYVVNDAGQAISVADTSQIAAMSNTFTPGTNVSNSFAQAGVVEAFNATPTSTRNNGYTQPSGGGNDTGGRTSVFNTDSTPASNGGSTGGSTFNSGGGSFNSGGGSFNSGGGSFNSGGGGGGGGGFN